MAPQFKIYFLIAVSFLFLPLTSFAQQNDSRKSYLEDIFIWKMSEELKLTALEEKKFAEIQKDLNQKKLELNKSIQNSIESFSSIKENSVRESDKKLDQHFILIKKYNQLALDEFQKMRKLLGSQRFLTYLKIKNELTQKVKSLLAGESDKKELKPEKEKTNDPLPPPKVIVEE